MKLKNMVIAGAVSAALAITSPLLEEIEGIRFKPYKDIAGIWTVCAGITGPDVVLGKTYTQKNAISYFKSISSMLQPQLIKRLR